MKYGSIMILIVSYFGLKQLLTFIFINIIYIKINFIYGIYLWNILLNRLTLQFIYVKLT